MDLDQPSYAQIAHQQALSNLLWRKGDRVVIFKSWRDLMRALRVIHALQGSDTHMNETLETTATLGQ